MRLLSGRRIPELEKEIWLEFRQRGESLDDQVVGISE